LSIGQTKSGPDADLCEDYEKRIRNQGRAIGITAVTSNMLAESRRSQPGERKQEESGRLSSALPDQAYTVVLSERGKQLSSTAFAQALQDTLDRGVRELAFMVGGPDGHDAGLERDAGMLLSFGLMTWPHRLARIMVLEQVYRAVTILTNHPYHRA
jgi:23S rRNA (pseudouridine1915-N3)-methyltransferase